jgi:hypothetical protein
MSSKSRPSTRSLLRAAMLLIAILAGTLSFAGVATAAPLPPCGPATDGLRVPDEMGDTWECWFNPVTGKWGWKWVFPTPQGSSSFAYNGPYLQTVLSRGINSSTGGAALSVTAYTGAYSVSPGQLAINVSTERWNGSAWSGCGSTGWRYNSTSTSASAYGIGGVGSCGSGYYRTNASGYLVISGSWYGSSAASPYIYVACAWCRSAPTPPPTNNNPTQTGPPPVKPPK